MSRYLILLLKIKPLIKICIILIKYYIFVKFMFFFFKDKNNKKLLALLDTGGNINEDILLKPFSVKTNYKW